MSDFHHVPASVARRRVIAINQPGRESINQLARQHSGVRLFEGVDADRVALELVRAEPSPRVTHLTYAVLKR